MADLAGMQAAFKAAFLAEPGLAADVPGLDSLMHALATALWPFLSMVANSGVVLTPEGGLARYMANGTGVATVKGSVVDASNAADDTFALQTDEYDAIGVVYEAGIAAGQPCLIVFSGRAEVLFRDTVAPVRGYWVFASSTDGRADCLAAPPGGGIPELDAHFKEIGHCEQSKTAGTGVVAFCTVHFN